MIMGEKKNNTLHAPFTLLEVIIALTILSVGVAGILLFISTSLERTGHNLESVEQTHDLVQAAEYLLLCGPDASLDTSVLSGEYSIRYEYLPYEDEIDRSMDTIPAGRFHLKTLRLTLYDKNNNEVDSLLMECWQEDLKINAR